MTDSSIPKFFEKSHEEKLDIICNFSDLNELAVGSGFGLRYDFNFFVLRLDTAFKTYNPAKVKNQRWFSDFSLNKAVFNIGINYPF